MALFFLLLAILGGAVVGDLIWENTDAGEVTMLDRTLVSYPQGWLLAAAAAIGFVTALLLVASVSSTKARRNRRRQFRAMKRDQQDPGFEPDHPGWLDVGVYVDSLTIVMFAMITLVNLSKRFGPKPLFEAVSMTFDPGKRYVLVGANGAGKRRRRKRLPCSAALRRG